MKKETIGIRCTAEQKKALEKAAEAERRTLSNFMLNAAIERMNQSEGKAAYGRHRAETPKAEEGSENILKSAKHNFR